MKLHFPLFFSSTDAAFCIQGQKFQPLDAYAQPLGANFCILEWKFQFLGANFQSSDWNIYPWV